MKRRNALYKGGFQGRAKKATALATAFLLLLQSAVPVVAEQTNAGNPASADQDISDSGYTQEAKASHPVSYLYVEETAQKSGQDNRILAQIELEDGEQISKAELTIRRDADGKTRTLSAEKIEGGSLVFATGTELATGTYHFGDLSLSFTEKESVSENHEAEEPAREVISIAQIPGLCDAAFGVDETVAFDESLIAEMSESVESEGALTGSEGKTESPLTEEEKASIVKVDTASFNAQDLSGKIRAALQNAAPAEEGLQAQNATGAEEDLSAEDAKRQKVVIVLDPGHDDTHCGARANGLLEEKLNLTVANYCKEYLEQNYSNVTVYMTRTSGACPHPGTTSVDDNAARVNAAASVGANAYVSIHFNSGSAGSSGAMVFYPNANYNADVSAAGRNLATNILANLVNLGLKNNGVKTYGSQSGDTYPDGSLADYYGVIRRSKLYGFPGIIIEHAFLTNGSDAAFCSSPENLKKLGIADAQGIAAAFSLKQGAPVNEDGKTVNEDGYKLTCELNKTETEATLTLTGTDKNDAGVFFNVYSLEDKMDDLESYDGEKESNKKWSTKIKIADHATAGEYKAFAYTVDKYGNEDKVATASFTVKGPSATEVTYGKVNVKKGTFKVKAKGVTAPSGVKKVVFSVTNQSGSKKTVPVEAKKKSDYYYANVNLSQHEFNAGKYEVKVIVTDQTDIEKEVLTKTEKIDVPEPEITAKLNKSQSKITITAKNVALGGKVTAVKFKVKSVTAGKTKSYVVKKASKKTYTAKVKISDFGAPGTYKITTYVKKGTGKYTKIGKKKKGVVSGVTAAGFNYAANGTNGNILTIGKPTSASPVKTMEVKVWPRVKKSASFVYAAEENADGSWEVKVNNKNHKKATGTYICEVTATLKNGVKQTIIKGNFELGQDPTFYAIAGASEVTLNQMVAYFSAHSSYPLFYSGSDAASLRKFCKLYLDECAAEGIKAEVAFAQAMKETNFLRFGGDVSINQYNFAGLGATGGGVAGNSYPSVQIGIRAQVQHLKGYANSEPLNKACVDDRFTYVARNTAPYVEWLGIPDNPYGKGWAADTNYGGSILGMIAEMKTYTK
ncbi:MAG: GBS Bsp-like repeat-containing protein [Lachnospiraceae bacterium]|nr:GBS Bsp-like repeat-containing protein [Lachnospiraceae bacterium]